MTGFKNLAAGLTFIFFIVSFALLTNCGDVGGGGDDDADVDDDIDDDDDSSIDSDVRISLDLKEGCNPFAMSDECVFPYPSAFFQVEDPTSPTGVRVNYLENVFPGYEEPPIDVAPMNTADGCPPAGPILLHFGVDVHSDFLTTVHELEESLASDSPVALFNYETGERVMFMSEMDMNRRDDYPNRYAFIIRPMEPMGMGMRHVVVLTKDMRDSDGKPFESPKAFVVLRDKIPTINGEIEKVRGHYEEIFGFLEEHGYERDNLLLVWDFMVASKDYLLGSVLSMREETLDEAGGTGLSYVLTRVANNPNQYLSKIVEGDFEVPNFLREDNTFEYDENHHPTRQPDNAWFPFTMIIPKKAQTLCEPLPLVIFGHGIFGSGRSYLTGWAAGTTQPIAEEAGAIIIATDWIGLASGDLDLIINEVINDLNKIFIVTDRLQQSFINNITMTELAVGSLSSDPAVKVCENELIDESRVYYYGVSLGGIQGSSFVSISNRITRGVMAVPGAVWLNMMPRSIVWVPMKVLMDVMYPDPLFQQLAIALIQTQFDHSDPINLTRLMFKDPLPDAPDNRTAIFQESIGDCQVPNMTTEMLARAVGVKLVTPSIYDVFGLNTVTSPTAESVLVQYHLVGQAEDPAPPEENIPPEDDNGVHSDVVFLPHVLEQVKHFLETGKIVQYCDGPCDPD